MLGLIAAFLFGGYLLVYAAVADGGKFAASPWDALRFDAYAGANASSASGGGAGHSTLDLLIGTPGHRGIVGNWISGVIAGKTSGSVEHPAPRGAAH